MSTFNSRSAAVLIIVISLLCLGGCVTKGSEEKGGMFFETKNWKKSPKEDSKSKSWKKFKEDIVGKIRRGQGTMTVKEARALLPLPNMEGETSTSMALGWYFSDADNTSWDIAIWNRSSSIEYGYLLVVGFTEKGILNHFDVQNVVMPSKSWSVTSHAIIGELVAIKNMQILSDMIGKALDRSADRAVDKADQRFNATIDRREAELIDKVKSSTTGMTGDMGGSSPGGSPTVTITVSPGTSSSSPTIQ